MITHLLSALVLSASLGAAAPATAAAAAASGPDECRSSDLSAAYRGGDGATSHVYGRIVLRNVSNDSCWIQGYGGLSYVGGGDGHQIGAAADRTSGAKPRVVLQPGEKVRSRVVETSTGPYSQRECRPRPVDGFRVYPPDETHSLYVAHPTTGCSDDDIHLITHTAYR